MSLFNEVKKAYKEPHRHYHNLNHLYSMFRWRDIMKKHVKIENPKLLSIAIQFHDFVYDVHNPRNNEYLSAKAALEYCTKKLNIHWVDAFKVSDMVLVTDHKSICYSDDERLICDLDLASLGCKYKQFVANNKNIRKEYSHINDEEFSVANSKILQSFLDKKYIYYTEYFRNKYELKARRNISRLLEDRAHV